MVRPFDPYVAFRNVVANPFILRVIHPYRVAVPLVVAWELHSSFDLGMLVVD